MAPRIEWRWLASLVVAVLSLLIAVGYLDVLRGRELTILRTNQEWVMREIVAIRDEMRQQRGRRGE